MLARHPLAVLAAAALVAGCTFHPASKNPSRTEAATPPAGPVTTTTVPAPPTTRGGPGQASGAPVTLAFGGDVHFEGVIRGRLADPATTLGPIAAVLEPADLAMVNLETAVTGRGTPQSKQFTFRAPPVAFEALRRAGVDVATMANNHGEDYGPVGLRDSLAAARAARFPVVGIGRSADEAYRARIFTVRGQRIAIVGATQVLDGNLAAAWTAGDDKPGLASAYQVPRLLAAVRTARRQADTVVVYLHWGRELHPCPLERQRTIAAQLVAAGADVVVGSHAHIQLGAGWLRGAYVDYGLGNFVFYSSGGTTARSGVLLLTVRGRAVTAARWVPAVISGGVPVPLRGAAAAQARARWAALRGCTGLRASP